MYVAPNLVKLYIILDSTKLNFEIEPNPTPQIMKFMYSNLYNQ